VGIPIQFSFIPVYEMCELGVIRVYTEASRNHAHRVPQMFGDESIVHATNSLLFSRGDK